MAKCEIHKKAYYSKECPMCVDERKRVNVENLSEKDKLFKTIRYVLIAFVGLLIAVTIYEIYFIEKISNAAEPSVKEMERSLKNMNDASEKMLKNIEKGFKIPNQR